MAQIPRSNQVPNHPNAPYTAGHNVGYPHPVSVGYSQPQGSGYSQTTPSHTYENVAPAYAVKYPPSMDPTSRPGPGDMSKVSSQQLSVSDISKQLDFATKENLRLKQAVEENNHFMEQRLHEFVTTQSSNRNPQVRDLEMEVNRLRGIEGEVARLIPFEQEVNRMKGKVSEATNRFFEARVAVMGFKCKVMQLEGQQGKQQHAGNPSRMRELEDEQKSLVAVKAQLKDDLEALANKKKIVEEERDRMKQSNNSLMQQLSDKETFIQQHLRMSTHDHSLRGEIQELTTKKSALEGEVARTKQSNDQLLFKVRELQESRQVIMEKLERMESMSPTGSAAMPVAKPRTMSGSRLEHEMNRIQEENTSLIAERDQLRSELERAAVGRATVDNMFQESNKKSQNLTEENLSLRQDIEKLEMELRQREEALERRRKEEMERGQQEGETLRVELRSLGKEKNGLVARVTALERQLKEGNEERDQLRQNKEHFRAQNQKNKSRVAELEQQLGAAAGDSAEPKSYTSIRNISAKKLNDALGKIRELEAVKGHLEEEVEEVKQSNALKIRHLHSRMEGLEEELRVEKEEGSKISSDELSELQAENFKLRGREQQLGLRVQQLESEQQHHVEESLRMRQDVDRHRQDLASGDSAKRELRRQISEKESEVAQLRDQFRALQEQLDAEVKNKTKNTTKLDSLQQNLSEERKRHQAESEEKRTRLQMLEEEKGRITVEKEDLQQTCEEFRKESESILQDYNMCAQRLKVAEETANRWTAQHQKDQTEQARMRERISLLEQSRKEQDDKLTHMDQQIKIYHEDFDRERNAREAAVKVKNLAEERMKKMDRELKELRDRLNQQAVRSLREEPYEDGSYSSSSSHMDTMSSQRYSGPHTKSGEQYPGSQAPSAWNAPAPGSGGQQHHHGNLHPQQMQRRSGDVGSIPTGPSQGGLENAPVSQGGGYGGPGRMPPYRAGAGGQMPPSTAWTTVNPPTTQASHYHHANKTALDRTMDRPLDQTGDRGMNPMGGLSPSMPGNRREPVGVLPPPGRRDASMSGRREMHMEYGHPAGGMNDLNNPPSHAATDMGGVNDLASYHPPVAQGQSYQPLDQRHGGRDQGPIIGIGGPNIGIGRPPITLPGEITNSAPPTMACPICNRENFKTQTELEIHSAQCI